MSKIAEALQKSNRDVPWWQHNRERILVADRFEPTPPLPAWPSAPDTTSKKFEWLQAMVAVRFRNHFQRNL